MDLNTDAPVDGCGVLARYGDLLFGGFQGQPITLSVTRYMLYVGYIHNVGSAAAHDALHSLQLFFHLLPGAAQGFVYFFSPI